MTTINQVPRARRRRATVRRHYLMAEPTHLDVLYSINPWMDPTAAFDRERAIAQWTEVRTTLERLGHRVDIVPAVEGLPDLVFSANGALVIGDVALLSLFRHGPRRSESTVHERHLRDRGLRVVPAVAHFEGEGDVVVVDDLLLAGHGFRTSTVAIEQLRATFDREVLDLALVDPRYYHLDTAVGVAGSGVVVWYPPAIAEADAERFRRRFPAAVEVDEHDALLLGCNLVGDGRHALVPAGVGRLRRDLEARGLEVVEIEVDELRRAGGGPKCCTAEWHDGGAVRSPTVSRGRRTVPG